MYGTLEYFFQSFPRKVFSYVLKSKLALSQEEILQVISLFCSG